MVFVIGLLLFLAGILLLRNQKVSHQKEDFLLIGFQFRIMIYTLIGSGIVLVMRELVLLFI